MNRFAKQLLPFCSLIFIISLCTFLEPDNFLSARNLVNVLCRSSINGIMAAGMTYIIITGGIDLSVGSMLAVCGMIGAASMLYFSGGTWADISSGSYIHLKLGAMIAGTLVCVLAGAVCGFANGMLITKLKLAPFIVTLGTMSIFRGISYIMNAGKPFAVSDYSWLDTGRVAGIPSSVILLVIVMVAFWFLLKHTRFGRYTYAIGSNVQTAFHAGINVNKTIVWIYTLTGALVGLASMITVARASTAQPTAGISLELDIIAACIIGGCAPSGGRGTMMGTVIGTLLISFLRNGLTLLDISTNVQLVVIGLIIIVAVTADQIATRRKAT
ncbi:MAG: ABC transporter permease [Lentisphaeria bacterium]|nr:ABC transporter permease [Lentisphaeria bacterium]